MLLVRPQPGQNAPPVITIKSLPSPMKGEATLTDSQISDLQAGMWYFNIHTAGSRIQWARSGVQVTKASRSGPICFTASSSAELEQLHSRPGLATG